MLYRKVIQPLLYTLGIERAHRLSILLLQIAGSTALGRHLLRAKYRVDSESLEREVFGVKFSNPVGLAAGFDCNAEVVREMGAIGFGFVEIGTVTPQPQDGNMRPRIFRLHKDKAIIQRRGQENRGWLYVIDRLRRQHKGVVVGCNIGRGVNTPPESYASDYLKSYRNLYQYVDYFTVNLSFDNAILDPTCYERENLLAILEPLFEFRRGQSDYRPIMLKLSPDLTNEQIDEVTDVLIDSPLDGVVAVGGSLRRNMPLNTSRASIVKVGKGYLSGEPLKQRALEVVQRVYQRSGGCYPIIGVGGISSVEDARAMLAAGASLVQLYTGFVFEGPKLVGDICRGLSNEVNEN